MLLINPFAKTNKEIPNLQLAYIGTITNSKIIDLNTKPEPFERFLDCKSDVLGISLQSRTHSEAKKIIGLYKAKYPDSKAVSVSGIIDIECCYPFLKSKENLGFEQSFGDNLPFPDYELFDSFEIFKEHWQKGDWPYAIMTSQGCPYQCIYCAARMREFRARSVENCYQELKQAKEKYKIKSFQILDDCFNLTTDRVIEFSNKVKKLNLSWHCSNGLRINSFNEEAAKALSDSGCEQISFGIESIHNDILVNIKKGINRKMIEQAVKIAKKYFSGVNGYFIIGLPGSNYKKDLESLHWALRTGINAHFSYYVPFDKSMVYDETFYGKLSKPISNEYSQNLQKRIGDLNAFMRLGPSRKDKFFITVKAIFQYDFLYSPFYVKTGLKKLWAHFLNSGQKQ